jgi:hypothetical protein
MKKTIFIVLVLIIANKLTSAQGLLAFFSENGEKFWVIIDGRKINQEPKYLVDSIPFNMKWGKAKIIFEDPKLPSFDKTFQVVDVDENFCYVKYMIYKTKKGKYNAKESSFSPLTTSTINKPATQSVQPSQMQNNQVNVSIPDVNNPSQNVNMSYQVTTTVNEQGNQTIQLSLPVIQESSSQTQHVVSQTSLQMQPVQQSQTNIISKPATVQQSTNNKGACSNPMKDEDFQSAKQSIVSKSFEDSKLTLAKQITSSNCLLSSQVRDIMKTFSFESSRLEYAKFAYKYTYDKENYFKVNDAFQFESSIDELNEFINNK